MVVVGGFEGSVKGCETRMHGFSRSLSILCASLSPPIAFGDTHSSFKQYDHGKMLQRGCFT